MQQHWKSSCNWSLPCCLTLDDDTDDKSSHFEHLSSPCQPWLFSKPSCLLFWAPLSLFTQLIRATARTVAVCWKNILVYLQPAMLRLIADNFMTVPLSFPVVGDSDTLPHDVDDPVYTFQSQFALHSPVFVMTRCAARITSFVVRTCSTDKKGHSVERMSIGTFLCSCFHKSHMTLGWMTSYDF